MRTRSLLPILSVLLLTTLFSACTTSIQDGPTPADTWNKEKLLALLDNESTWRVESVFRKSGTETVDVSNELTGFADIHKKFFLVFRAGYVNNYLSVIPFNSQSSPVPGVSFADNVETYAAPTKVVVPSLGTITYRWDDDLQTVIFQTGSNVIAAIPANRSAVLDKSSIVMYDSLEEAKAAAEPSNLTLVVEEEDAKLGKVTYLFHLRKAWYYYSVPDNTSNIKYYAIL